MIGNAKADEHVTPDNKVRLRITDMFVISESRLTPEARIAEDLRIDGNDALELFKAISDTTGTDFSSLYSSWSYYFRNENDIYFDKFNKTGFLLILAMSVAASFAQIGFLAVSMFIFPFLLKKRTRHPIRIDHIVRSVDRRYWLPLPPSL